MSGERYRARIDRLLSRRWRPAVLVAVGAVGVLGTPASGWAADPPLPTTQAREFWTTFPQGFGQAVEGPRVLMAATRPTSGTVTMAGQPPVPFTVAPGATTTVSLPTSAQTSPETGPQAGAVHVQADDDVSVIGFLGQGAAHEAFLVLPASALGTDYLVLGWGAGASTGGSNGATSSRLAIAATRDGTTVRITPSGDATDTTSRPGGVPYEISLDRGDRYALAGARAFVDLTGTSIVADAPVAVLAGHECATIPLGMSFCNPVVEELPPVRDWGREFVVTPVPHRVRATVRVLAARDGTDVVVDGATVATLDRGEWHETVIESAISLAASKPVLVAQYSHGANDDRRDGDPMMSLVVPVERFVDGDHPVPTPGPGSGFGASTIGVVVPEPGVDGLWRDGAPVPPSAFAPVGASGFAVAELDVALGAPVLLGAAFPFAASIYGAARNDAYGAPAGMVVGPLAYAIALDPQVARVAPGQEHCLRATVFDAFDEPLAGVTVRMVASGANAAAGTAVTGAEGVARWCYVGTNEGVDTVVAASGRKAAEARVRWAASESPPPAPPTDTCSVGRKVELSNVRPRGRRVEVEGMTVSDLVGQAVTITRDGRRVASGRVRAPGAFDAVVRAPAASSRRAHRPRYQARIGGWRSRALVATRQLEITSHRAQRSGVQIRGRVGNTSRPRTLSLRRETSCGGPLQREIRRITTSARGTFGVQLPRPGSSDELAIYRVQTVRGGRTYTLPVVLRR